MVWHLEWGGKEGDEKQVNLPTESVCHVCEPIIPSALAGLGLASQEALVAHQHVREQSSGRTQDG